MSIESYQRDQSKKTPIWQILEHLQRNGSATIKELEDVLGVTTTAVRQHLNTLQLEGYVERQRVNTGVGRPHHAYFITEKAQDIFACHCDDLALTLLEEVFELEGLDKVGVLLERVSSRLADRYTSAVQSSVLHDRVGEFAAALNQRGVLTDVESEGDTITLKTYNCPWHDLAQEHSEICQMDQDMMRKVIGSDVSLTSRMMDGDPCCSFAVSKSAQNAETKK